MAGALSGHLIDQFHPNNPFNSSIISHGSMSFNPNMHGTPYAQQSFSFFGSQAQSSFTNDSISEETAKKIAALQVKLDQKLGPEYISQRPGPGGGPKLTYVEGWKIINLANEVFGFNGWSSSIISLTTDFADYNEETRRYNVGVTALMRVTLRDGVFHEDIGYGMLENSKSKGQAFDKCKKEAVTDGLKRALRGFGNVMGNCLYDKSYTAEVIKVKYEPKKFNKDELHRRPEFEDVKPNITSTSVNAPTSSSTSTSAASRAGPSNYTTSTPARPPMQQNQSRPMVPLPQHVRAEVHQPGAHPNAHTTPNQQYDHKGKGPAQPIGLNTPITTPLQKRSSIPQSKTPQLPQQQSSGQPPAPPPKPPSVPPVQAKMEIGDDDSFGFNSDDDAFLALVDLGPAIGGGDSDMGRPIISDEDMGRPIDQEEGLLCRPDDEETLAMPTNQRYDASVNPPSAVSSTSSSSGATRSRTRQELIAAALAGTDGESMSGVNGNGTNQQTQSRSGNHSVGSTSNMLPPPVPQHRSTTTLVQQNHQRYMQNRQNRDQNQAPAQQNNLPNFNANAAGKSSDMQKRSPSVGGFNFPSGVNLSGNVPSSTIGVKRPAEAMNSMNSGPNYRGAAPGMGLHQANSGSGTTAHGRSILGTLDITDGGDVKRRRP